MNTITRYFGKMYRHASNGTAVSAGIHSHKSRDYASVADFQEILTEQMGTLYSLAFVLTANPIKAEACLISGIGECVDGSQIFKEWARSWTRRTIVTNAIRMISPRPSRADEAPTTGSNTPTASAIDDPLAAVLRLKPFERFVFVMSILEKYADHECSSLLNCGVQDVVRGRTRALQESALDDALTSEMLLSELRQLANQHGENPETQLHPDPRAECQTS
jgi:hypothetical protein